MMPTAFDGLLALALLALAWSSLRARDLFHAVVLYVMFGLFVAIAWLRLHAPDIALAEVAIGAGLTGALFLGALGRMESRGGPENERPPGTGRVRTVPLAILVAALGVILFRIVTRLAVPWPGLADEVGGHLSDAGASNPVTAVVLNFRGYDTVLEVGVLLFALLGAHTVLRTLAEPSPELRLPPDSMLVMFMHLFTPMLILTAAYLIWVGDHAPGGAFQAGALLGGIGVVLLLSGLEVSFSLTSLRLRMASAAGLAVFTLVGLAVTGTGRFLEYPAGYVKPLLLLIELASAFSIGIILASMFAACASLLHPPKPVRPFWRGKP